MAVFGDPIHRRCFHIRIAVSRHRLPVHLVNVHKKYIGSIHRQILFPLLFVICSLIFLDLLPSPESILPNPIQGVGNHRHSGIEVIKLTVPGNLPRQRNGNVVPVFDVVAGLLKVNRGRRWVLAPVELPRTAQQLIAFGMIRGLPVRLRPCRFFARKTVGKRMGR